MLGDRFIAVSIVKQDSEQSCSQGPASFPSLALHTANDGKLDGAWGTRIVISDSMHELSSTGSMDFVTARNGH